MNDHMEGLRIKCGEEKKQRTNRIDCYDGIVSFGTNHFVFCSIYNLRLIYI
jgi:hypothetical protein